MANTSNRKKILSAAARLFSQRGYKGTSMRDVASSVGVTLPTIYHYFGNKRKLYAEVKIDVFAGRSTRHVKKLRSGKPAPERVYAYLLALATDLMNNPVYFKLLHREMLDQDTSGLQRLSRESFHEGFAELSAALADIAPERNASELSLTLLSLQFGLISTIRYARYLDPGFAEFRTPERIVRLTLEQLIPQIAWSQNA